MDSSSSSPPLVHHSSLNPFAVPLSSFLATTPIVAEQRIRGVCANTVIFYPSEPGAAFHDGDTGTTTPSTALRVLLLRRCPTDVMGDLWEPPGGGIEPTDATLLCGAAREAKEESGLDVVRMQRVAGDAIVYYTGKADGEGERVWYMKLDFVGEVDAGCVVRLDPNEHVEYVWASEEEVRREKMGDGKPIPITYPQQKENILDAFRWRKGQKVEGVALAEDKGKDGADEDEWTDTSETDSEEWSDAGETEGTEGKPLFGFNATRVAELLFGLPVSIDRWTMERVLSLYYHNRV